MSETVLDKAARERDAELREHVEAALVHLSHYGVAELRMLGLDSMHLTMARLVLARMVAILGAGLEPKSEREREG